MNEDPSGSVKRGLHEQLNTREQWPRTKNIVTKKQLKLAFILFGQRTMHSP
jgi:hypothetical protein